MKVQLLSLQLSIWLMMMAPVKGSIYNNNITYRTDTQCSTLRPIVDRVFSRKKRFLLLPPGGSIKFTALVSKNILARYPRGFSFAVEAATYYEGFTQRIDLIPSFLRKPTPAKPKPAVPAKPLYVYIPGTEIRYKAVPAKKPSKVQRIDANETALQWVDSQPVNKYEQKYADPNHWHQYTKYGNPDYQQKYAWTPKPNAKWTHWGTTAKPKRWWQPRQLKENYYDPERNTHTTPLHHYHGRRDRRQLYQSFEALSSVLGFDVKVCILRAICECQSLLLPPGYSMLQDMMRAILTVPYHHGINDEYIIAMGGNVDTCEKEYHQKCPISLVTWLMNPIKTVKS